MTQRDLDASEDDSGKKQVLTIALAAAAILLAIGFIVYQWAGSRPHVVTYIDAGSGSSEKAQAMKARAAGVAASVPSAVPAKGEGAQDLPGQKPLTAK